MWCRHTYRRYSYRGPIYRHPEKGYLGGVCAGIADHLGIPPLGTRILFVLATFMTGIFPCLAFYVILVTILPVKEADDSIATDFKKHSVANRLQTLDRRIGSMESYLVSSEYEWERKYRGLS